jgi:hypothetical protein
VLLILCSAQPEAAVGQIQPLITDRPDFTESPFVVPVGSFQLETGITREAAHGVTSLSGLEALLRWSPAARIELRFQPPGYIDGGAAHGYTDIGLGAKVELGAVGAWSLGAIASVGVPTGSFETSAGTAEPQLILAAGREFHGVWSLGTQASVARIGEADAVRVGSTLVAGRALTERVAAFIEVAVDRESGADTWSVLHGGFTFSVSPSLQLDLHVVGGLTGSSPTQAVGLGFSTRFD